MEYKQVIFEKSKTKEDSEYFYFEGYASTFGNIDNGGDIVVKGAFTGSLTQRLPKMVYQHDLKDPIGVYTYAYEDKKGLYVKGKMPLANSKCKDVSALIKCGAIDSMSIGFTVDDYNIKDGKRYLTKLNLWEVSPVTIPMNSEALITSFKSVTPFQDLPIANRDRKWNADAATTRIRKFTDSEDAPSESYRKAFMWFDQENSDKFTAYKLPYADVVNGKLMAIPQSIISIAAVLNGARGGTNISKEDQDKIKLVIKKYYLKMKMPNPWESDKMSLEDLDYKRKRMKDEEDEDKRKKRMKDDEEEDDEDEKADSEDDDDSEEEEYSRSKRKKGKKLRSADKSEEDEDDDEEDKPKAKKSKRKPVDEEDDDSEEDEKVKKRKNKKSLDMWDLKDLSKHELEFVLRESGLFSKSGSTYLASFFHKGRSESDQYEKESKSNTLEDALRRVTLSLKKFKG